jgi:predicted dehydrogenase
MTVYWNGSGIWWNPRAANQTDMEYQLRNWYHHVWLCGDQIVEQHIHNLDVANWVMNATPISAYGSGGRQSRKEPGEIWDNFTVEYEYPNGARVMSMCRHWPQSDENISEFALGTKGKANPGGWIEVKNERKDYRNNLTGYIQEHVDLIKSLQDGKPINEAKQVAHSTLTAIMGRMSAYTGKKVTWDFALNQSKLDLLPRELNLDAVPPPVTVAEPGKTKLI